MTDQHHQAAPTAARIEFDATPPPAEREMWCEWLRRHGVDPCDVVLPGWIERHPSAYRLVYASVARDENGRLYRNRPSTDAVREVRYVQLEGPPLPFPLFNRRQADTPADSPPPPPQESA